MITITQGPPAEHQVWIACGIALFAIMAPVLILTAGVIGYLTRPTRNGHNADSMTREMADA